MTEQEIKPICLFTNGNVVVVDEPELSYYISKSRTQNEYNSDYRVTVARVLTGDYTFNLVKWQGFSYEITLDEFCLLFWGKTAEQLRVLVNAE